MKRCPYCGHRCYGRTCTYHADLRKIETTMGDERGCEPDGCSRSTRSVGSEAAHRLPSRDEAIEHAREELREAVRRSARRGEVFEGDHIYDTSTGKLIFGEDETAALVREARGKAV